MDSKTKAKLKEFLINRDIDRALRFLEAVEVHEGNYTDSQRNAAWLYMTMKAKNLHVDRIEGEGISVAYWDHVANVAIRTF